MSSFFKKFFGGGEKTEPNVQFGRFSDFYKDKSKNTFWDLAIENHDKKNYQKSIIHFLEYLSDESLQNVQFEVLDEKIKFIIYQGSKKIEGFANQDSFFAEAKIAHCTILDLGVLRTLLEENYGLQYSSFALDSDNNLTLIFHTDYLEATPYKLYYGLKEMATRADKRDDVLISNYDSLEPINIGKIIDKDAYIKKIYFDFFQSKLTQAYQKIDGDFERLKSYPALINYRLIGECLTIDYLLKPEGITMEHIDKIFNINSGNKALSPEQKNKLILKEIKHLMHVSKEDFDKEIYETTDTFGWLPSGNHLRFKELIDTEMQHADWYCENGYEDYASYIPSYIASVLLYSYAMPLPHKKYLHLIMRIYNDSFFVSLGYQSLFKKNNEIQKSSIENILDKIILDCQENFSGLEDINNKLSYKSSYTLAKSIFIELYKLDIKKNKS